MTEEVPLSAADFLFDHFNRIGPCHFTDELDIRLAKPQMKEFAGLVLTIERTLKMPCTEETIADCWARRHEISNRQKSRKYLAVLFLIEKKEITFTDNNKKKVIAEALSDRPWQRYLMWYERYKLVGETPVDESETDSNEFQIEDSLGSQFNSDFNEISDKFELLHQHMNAIASDSIEQQQVAIARLSKLQNNIKQLEKTITSQRVEVSLTTVNNFNVTQINILNLLERAEQLNHFKYIDEAFWKKLIVANQDYEAFLKLNKEYFIHGDVNYIAKAVANELLIEPNMPQLVTWQSGEQEFLTILQLLQIARAENLSLIKVLADGGFGKTSYLWWLAKQYYSSYNTYFVEKVKSAVVAKLIADIQIRNTFLPTLIILDDIVDKDLNELLATLKLYTDEQYGQIIVIVAERETIYTRTQQQLKRQREDIEQFFNDRVWTIHYSIYNEKAAIFKKVYPLLSSSIENKPDRKAMNMAYSVFTSPELTSLTESIFQLVLFLKKDYHLNYLFDWDEWDRFISNNRQKYGVLESLFDLTACFFQFGISLPLNFLVEYYEQADIDIKIIDAISDFGINSPIRLDSEGSTALVLRNNYVAIWYTVFPKHNEKVKLVLKSFLESFKKPLGVDLFLKLTRLVRSHRIPSISSSNLLNVEEILNKLNTLLQSNLPHPIHERVLMEIGLLFLPINLKKSIAAFETIISSSENKYAHHQLAEIYAKEPSSYSKAIKHYLSILDQDDKNPHAMVGLYILANECKRRQIHMNMSQGRQALSFFDAVKFSAELTTHSLNQFLTTLIYDNEFYLAEELLDNLKIKSHETAKCHYLLAKLLPFNEANISIKHKHYLKSIEINTNKYTYQLEYAVFLFRLGNFNKATALIKTCFTSFPKFKDEIRYQYETRIFLTEKLFFEDLPSTNNKQFFKEFLENHYQRTRALISPKYKKTEERKELDGTSSSILETANQKSERVLKGYLLLKTIAYHSKHNIPELYHKSLSRLAACHYQNAKFGGWTNLNEAENYEIAEVLYDQLFEINQRDREVNENICWNMRNIISLSSDVKLKSAKLKKMLRVCNRILGVQLNKNHPDYYRQRAFAHHGLGNSYLQFKDAKMAMENCKRSFYPNENAFKTAMPTHMNNFILAVCSAIGQKQKLIINNYRYGIQDAVYYYHKIERQYPAFKYLSETKSRILLVAPKAFKT